MSKEVSRARYGYIHDKGWPPKASYNKGHAFGEIVGLVGLGRRQVNNVHRRTGESVHKNYLMVYNLFKMMLL